MGQCVSRNPMAPYAAVRPYDSASLSGFSLPVSAYEDYCYGGQSDSKGARSKRPGASGGRGAAMSFGFRGRKAGAKGGGGASDAGRISAAMDKNGNGGSTEELFTGSPVMSGRSTPLARPRKEASGQPLRTNRFGFRQNAMAKTAKVADINMSAEQALSANHREQESKNNNFINDKIATRPSNVTFGLIPTQISPNGIANITSPPKPTQTKQTIILTYSAKQYPSAVQNSHNLRSKSPAIPSRVTAPHNPNPGNQRSASASRAYTTSSGYDVGGFKIGNLNKYTLQTNQLPKPQYPSVKLLDSKSAKQVANNTRKGYGSSEGSSKEGSMTEDSGVGVDVDSQPPEGGWSPRSSQRQHRRPRTLEMVMRGEHSFHLRELQVSDLDIMDEAIVTDVDVIPLPKLPSTFDKDNRPDMASDYPPTNRFSRLLSSIESESQPNRPGFSTLERYRNNRDRDRRTDSTRAVPDNVIDKEEEKVCRDRLQREKNEKQDCMKMSSNSSHSPLTSKESSPSTKSEESHHSVASGCSDPIEAWMNHTAGESMALRSNDEDISAALSLSSSCDEEKGFNKSSGLASFAQTRVDIVHNEPRDYAKLTAHPMMLKSLTLSQNSNNIQSMLMSSSMSSSAFSGTSDSQQFTLLTEDPKAALAALASSNQSLIDDETSPADSLISSSSESNNEMPILEKDATMSSSAYHTADNKHEENKQEEEEKEVCEENNTKENGSNEKLSPQNKSPHTPGTPSHSLSLSEGRDFLIDDEIADQPALMFEANSTAEQMTSSLQLIHLNATDHTVTLQDPNESPLVTKKNKGLQNSQKMFSSPLFSRRAPPRSPSLDTLSPCDSIASDDLICDMDFNHSLTSLNSQDEYIDRLDSSIRSGLNSLEDTQLREELMKYTINHKRQLNNAMNCELSQNGTPTKHQGQSMTASNSSIANIGAALPVRTRLLSRSRAPTPEVRPRPPAGAQAGPGAPPPPPDEGALRLERAAHGCMQQDIVAIKAMLHKLKRVLQEPDEGHNLMRTETLNPLDIQRDQTSCPLKNGPTLHLLGDLGEASPPPPPPEPHEEVADLRRQLVFLQSQLEERERMVKLLQQQMSKISQDNSPNGSGDHSRCNGATNNDDMCNVATQTERLRPLSQGQNLLHSLTSDTHAGGLVSWNEQRKPSKLSSPSDFNHPQSISTPRIRKQFSSSINSPNASDCERTIPIPHSRSVNSTSYDDSSATPGVPDSCVQVKTNCRIGSRYLQAIASKQSKLNKETPPCERSLRSRSLYSSRSKSIENFQNHSLCNTDNNTNGFKLVSNKTETSRVNLRLPQNGSESRSTKHHTSYTNIFNGTTNGNNDNDLNYFKVNGNLHNGYGNGNLTDTDENSDSGYKSLPPVIGLSIANKVSGIPRRSTHNELRFSSSKQAQTNKC